MTTDVTETPAVPVGGGYPVRVQALLDEPLSRWLWLVKWLLALPHYVVLAVLWVAVVVLTVVAAVAILFTERYPRAIFDFNLGVMRWTWRVQFYAYAALGTDRYPPFTLADVPDYPARLDVDYPERLSRGLVLVKWLLAIPHFLVVGVFVGGGLWVSSTDDRFQWGAPGLVGLLVFVAGVVLAVTGSYPRQLFDFVLGLNRWVLRVGAYAGLMTDKYPPFRLDMGGDDPAGAAPGEPVAHPAAPPSTAVWSPARVVAVVIGALFVLGSAGPLTGGGALLWVDRVHRDADGFIAASRTFASDGYAVASREITTGRTATGELPVVRALLGDLRVRATAVDSDVPVFVGIGPADAVAGYLAGVAHSEVADFADPAIVHRAGAPEGTPEAQRFWVAEASGIGTQALTWRVEAGDWTVVVLNADASQGVAVRVDAGAEVPALSLVAGLFLSIGIALLVVGTVLIAVAVHRSSRTAVAVPDESRHI